MSLDSGNWEARFPSKLSHNRAQQLAHFLEASQLFFYEWRNQFFQSPSLAF
jgi:hypothetical protein